MNRISPKFHRLLLFSLIAVMLVSGFLFLRELHGRRSDAQTFDELRQLAAQPSTTAVVQTTTPVAATSTSASSGTQASQSSSVSATTAASTVITTTAPEPVPVRNLSVLFAENPDCAGWVSIPGTALDYPFMHTPDEPEKYLRRSFYGSVSRSGVPFLDARCSEESDHLLLYGHNMKNGTMFSALTAYTDPVWRDAHPTIELETADGCKTYTVYAVAQVDAADMWYQFVDYGTPEVFDHLQAYLSCHALYDTGIVPAYGQQLLTLSTCDDTDDNIRLIVAAVEDTPATESE